MQMMAETNLSCRELLKLRMAIPPAAHMIRENRARQSSSFNAAHSLQDKAPMCR
jgi:hypothetical protein